MSRTCKVFTMDGVNDAFDNIRNAFNRRIETETANMYSRISSEANNAYQRAVNESKRNVRDVRNEFNRKLTQQANHQTAYTDSQIRNLAERQRQAMQNLSDRVYSDMENGFTEIGNRMNEQYRALNGQIDTLRDNTNRQINNLAQNTNRRFELEHEFTVQNINALNNSIDQLAHDTNMRIEREHQWAEGQIRDVHQRISDEHNWAQENFKVLDQSITDLSNEMDERFAAQNKINEQVRADINSIFKRFEQDRVLRNQYVKDVMQAINDIKERIDVERFAPEEWEQFVGTKLRNLEIATDAAVISIAANMLQDALFIEKKAFKNKAKLDAIINLANIHIDAALDFISKTQTLGGKGGQRDEINYWTRGEYEHTRKNLEDIKKDLADDPYKYDINQLKDRLKLVSDLEAKCPLLQRLALENKNNAGQRLAMANDIIKAMEKQGYTLKSSSPKNKGFVGGDEDNDYREGAFAIMKDGLDNELTVIVQPSANGKPQIVFHRNDEKDITVQRYMDTLKKFKAQIETSGYQLGEIQAPADGGNHRVPGMGNGELLSKAGGNQLVNNI